MKRIFKSFLCLACAGLLSATELRAQFVYLNPMPGSSHHNPQVTLAIRNGASLRESALRKKDWIRLTGSVSGVHEYTCRLSDDGKTVVVKPTEVFQYGETVTVTIESKLEKESGELVEGETYSFKIRNRITPEEKMRYEQAEKELMETMYGINPAEKNQPVRDLNLDSLPTFTILANNNAAPGRIFYNNQFDFDPGDTNSFPTIIENDGTLVWAQDMGLNGHGFQINHNGYLTYWNYYNNNWVMADSNYNPVDSFIAGNGYEYETNGHDFAIYPDGHSFFLIYNKQTVDMTAYGGQPDAVVTGLIIQEQDKNQDVVFEWSSWDHFEISDAASTVILVFAVVDYVHANSIFVDTDGNLVISCRHLNEITKINRTTGEIMWRMNGENNEFTFVDDNLPEHFHYQHDVSRLPNGNLLLYNNGNYLPVQRSSAKEYHVDELNKVATLVWYYEHPDVNGFPVYGPATGSVQRLPNGNTLIDWGSNSVNVNRMHFTEVDSTKNITWEFKFDEYGQKSYRARKYEWYPCSRITPFTMKSTPKGSKMILSWGKANGANGYEFNFRKLGDPNWIVMNVSKPKAVATGLSKATTYEWRVKTICDFNPLSTSNFSAADSFVTLGLRAAESAMADVAPDLFQVYPVPVTDRLTIDLQTTETTAISIYNLMGVKYFYRVITTAEMPVVTLDATSWPKGTYFVEVRCGEQSQVRKIIME